MVAISWQPEYLYIWVSLTPAIIWGIQTLPAQTIRKFLSQRTVPTMTKEGRREDGASLIIFLSSLIHLAIWSPDLAANQEQAGNFCQRMQIFFILNPEEPVPEKCQLTQSLQNMIKPIPEIKNSGWYWEKRNSAMSDWLFWLAFVDNQRPDLVEYKMGINASHCDPCPWPALSSKHLGNY